jgi:hypothetical protein
MVEPVYFEDFFYEFSYSSATAAFACVLLFLLSFCILTPFIVRFFRPSAVRRGPSEFDLILSKSFQ